MRIAVVLSILAVAAPASAQRLPDIFARANQAASAGDYDDAIRDYELLLAGGVEDADVLYNLGTVHAKRGDYGHAIRYLEWSLDLRPGDDDVEASLASVRAAVAQRRAQAEGEAQDAPLPLGESIVRSWSESGLAWALLVLDVLLFGLLIIRRFSDREPVRLGIAIAVPFVAILTVLAGTGLSIKAGAFRDGERGFVVARDATLLEGPDPRAAQRGPAGEGQRVAVLAQEGDFVDVRLATGGRGWLPAADVGLLSLPGERH